MWQYRNALGNAMRQRRVPFLELRELTEEAYPSNEGWFGERDAIIPPQAVQRHREAYPQMEIYTYPAGHAFNRDIDGTHYDAPSAQLARQRTLAFFAKHIG